MQCLGYASLNQDLDSPGRHRDSLQTNFKFNSFLIALPESRAMKLDLDLTDEGALSERISEMTAEAYDWAVEIAAKDWKPKAKGKAKT